MEGERERQGGGARASGGGGGVRASGGGVRGRGGGTSECGEATARSRPCGDWIFFQPWEMTKMPSATI